MLAQRLLDKKGLVGSAFASLDVAGGAAALVLRVKKAGTFCSAAGTATALAEGEAGGLRAEPELDSEETE
jgi:hypothetical protein